MPEGERRTQDDLSVALECNTEGWPDGPDAWAQVLSWVWAAERVNRLLDWERQEDKIYLVQWRLWSESGRLMAAFAYPSTGGSYWHGWNMLAPGTYHISERAATWFRWQAVKVVRE